MMKRNRFAKIAFTAVVILISASFVHSQGTQILYNGNFENADSDDNPDACMIWHSGEILEPLETFPVTYGIFDWFSRLTNWVSYYQFDNQDCNYDEAHPDPESTVDWFVHSPDWIGTTSGCNMGWDQNSSVAMYPYEVFWQDFVGAESSKQLDINKSYEVRIRVVLDPENYYQVATDKLLDVLLGTQAFTYKRDERGYTDIFADDGCGQCDNNYREYLIAGSEDIRIAKRFPISDLVSSNINSYSGYSYGHWVELHYKIIMADLDFTNPFIPIGQFVQFGLDLRGPDPSEISDDGSKCNGPYLQIDQVEFFESCPDHYEIYGAMIAGQQSDYVATNYVKAGNIAKGPAIITDNGKTSFIAGHYVELVPGFLSDNGSVFDAIAITNVDCSLYRSEEIDDPNVELNRREQNKTISTPSVNNSADRIFKIYPNPASNICIISSVSAEILSFTVSDNIGKTVLVVDNIKTKEYQLDISNLPIGTYSVVIKTSKNETYHEKLVKI